MANDLDVDDEEYIEEVEISQEEQEMDANEPTASNEDVVDDLNYDLFNLSAFSYHPLRWKNDSKRESVIIDESTRAVQLLYRK